MKKVISVLLALVLTAAALGGCHISVTHNGDGESTAAPAAEKPAATQLPEETEAPPDETPPEVNIRPAEWEQVQWQPYACTYFTLNIPAGWQVKWDGNAQQLWWSVTSPDGTIGVYNLDHDYAAKDPDMTATLGFKNSLNDASVEGYFNMLYADSTDYFTVQNSYEPANKEILQASAPNKTIQDYRTLYATFKDAAVGEGEGVYSAVLVDSRDIYIRGVNYSAWEIDCIFTSWSPLGEFVNWKDVLAQIAQSFTYTDAYIQEWRSVLNSSDTPSSSANDTDPVMEAFEERSKSDTIIQEKRSDMLGEYERVYDNESGGIYRAYNGFLDDMGDQNRFTPITDNQYTEGYDGWIDKYD